MPENLMKVAGDLQSWINTYQGRRAKARINRHVPGELLRLRKELSDLEYAKNARPGIGIYGNSGSGKSTLIADIIGESLTVDGKPTSFHHLNPQHGGNREATSVITRFKAFEGPNGNPSQAQILVMDRFEILCSMAYGSYCFLDSFDASKWTEQNLFENVEQSAATEDSHLEWMVEIASCYRFLWNHPRIGKLISQNSDRCISPDKFEQGLATLKDVDWVRYCEKVFWPGIKALTDEFRAALSTQQSYLGKTIYISMEALPGLLDFQISPETKWESNGRQFQSEDLQIHFLGENKIQICCANGTRRLRISEATDLRNITNEIIVPLKLESIPEASKDVVSQYDLLDFPGCTGRMGENQATQVASSLTSGAGNPTEVQQAATNVFRNGAVSFRIYNYSKKSQLTSMILLRRGRMNDLGIDTETSPLLEEWRETRFLGKDWGDLSENEAKAPHLFFVWTHLDVFQNPPMEMDDFWRCMKDGFNFLENYGGAPFKNSFFKILPEEIELIHKGWQECFERSVAGRTVNDPSEVWKDLVDPKSAGLKTLLESLPNKNDPEELSNLYEQRLAAAKSKFTGLIDRCNVQPIELGAADKRLKKLQAIENFIEWLTDKDAQFENSGVVKNIFNVPLHPPVQDFREAVAQAREGLDQRADNIPQFAWETLTDILTYCDSQTDSVEKNKPYFSRQPRLDPIYYEAAMMHPGVPHRTSDEVPVFPSFSSRWKATLPELLGALEEEKEDGDEEFNELFSGYRTNGEGS